MQKFTYPIVFIFNEDTEGYCGFIPDLCLYSEGDTLEEVYQDAEIKLHDFFVLSRIHAIDYNEPTPLEQITKQWPGYKISL